MSYRYVKICFYFKMKMLKKIFYMWEALFFFLEFFFSWKKFREN